MAAGSEAVKETSERDFVISRVFDAPRALVFQAWTDPGWMAQWWGPRGFANPVCEIDARPGGTWRIVMRGPDGSEHPARGVYREVVQPERLVWTISHAELSDEWHDMVDPGRDRSKGKPALEAETLVTFEDLGGKTRVTVRMRFESAGVRDSLVKIGMNEGWSQSLERLEALLAGGGPPAMLGTTWVEGEREIMGVRLFDAPRELVFEMWTDPKHLVEWWGPTGFRTTMQKMEVRPGGEWSFVMHGPDGTDYQNHNTYIEVRRPERLVYSHDSAPKFRMTVTFAEEGGKTRLAARMLFETAAERDQTIKVFRALAGLSQTLGRLGEKLARMQGQ